MRALAAIVIWLLASAAVRADEAPISPARAAILQAATQLVDEWKHQPDKAAYRRLMFDEGADWGVPLPSGHGAKKTWGSHFGYARNWCTAFARTAYRRAFAALGTPLPIDLCPATATVPECKKLMNSTQELNNQSQAEVSTLREAFEHAGLAVVQTPKDPILPGRGDMVFLDGKKYSRGHVALVACVERSESPRAQWKAHLIEGNSEGTVLATDTVPLGSPLIQAYGLAEATPDRTPWCP